LKRKHRGKIAAVILVAVAHLLPGLALQAADIDEIIVVASRDVSGRIAVIKPLESVDPVSQQSFGITTADIISDLPGVTLNGQGGTLQAYSVRGFSRARIQTRLSGVPLSTERRAGNSASFLDPFLIGSIQVVKGPSSTLYGSGALGGIVSLQAKQFGAAEVIASIYSEGQQSMLGLGWGSHELSMGVAIRSQQESRDGDGEDLNDSFDRGSAVLSWSRELHHDLQFKVTLLGANGDDMGKSSADYPERKITAYPEEEHWLSSWSLSGKDKWTLGFYTHDQQLDTRIERPGTRLNATSSSSFDYGANWIYQWKIKHGSLRAGIDWDRRDDVRTSEIVWDAQGNMILQFNNLRGDQDTRAGYLDARWNLNKLTINTGTRWTSIKQRGAAAWKSDDHWTWVAAGRYSVNDVWGLFTEISTGFRFPELTERFFDGTTGRGTIIGQPALKAETALSREAGAEWNFGDVRIFASVYAVDVDDYIDRYDIADDILSYRNLRDGHIDGIEISASYSGERWLINLNGHWVQGEDEADNYLADINPPRVTMDLTYHAGWGDIRLNYRHRFSSGRVHASELPVERFNRLSVSLTLPLPNNFALKIWGDNLLNDDYRLTADELSPRSTRRGAGISIDWHQ
jgi:iron complex outermembrane receptor protein